MPKVSLWVQGDATSLEGTCCLGGVRAQRRDVSCAPALGSLEIRPRMSMVFGAQLQGAIFGKPVL